MVKRPLEDVLEMTVELEMMKHPGYGGWDDAQDDGWLPAVYGKPLY